MADYDLEQFTYGNDKYIIKDKNLNSNTVNVGAKRIQAAVSDPTTDGEATEFIASISQDANGVITATKKSISAQVPGTAEKATKLSTARGIDGVKFDGTADIIHFATCTSLASDQAKVVTIPGYKLVDGAKIAVRFQNGNTYVDGSQHGSITLNVNDGSSNTGARSIMIGTVASGTWVGAIPFKAGYIYEFVYVAGSSDAQSYYVMIGEFDTNTTYSFADSYNASNNKGATVKTVTNAIEALDNTNISGFAANKTLSALSETDGIISASFQDIDNLDASKITTGTLGIARGGTGNTSFAGGRVIVSNTGGTGGAASALTVSATTATEVGYLSGVTSAIQTQINNCRSIFFASAAINSGTTSMAKTSIKPAGTSAKTDDYVIGNNGGIAKVTAVTSTAFTIQYVGVIIPSISWSYTSSSKSLALPTTAAISITFA